MTNEQLTAYLNRPVSIAALNLIVAIIIFGPVGLLLQAAYTFLSTCH